MPLISSVRRHTRQGPQAGHGRRGTARARNYTQLCGVAQRGSEGALRGSLSLSRFFAKSANPPFRAAEKSYLLPFRANIDIFNLPFRAILC